MAKDYLMPKSIKKYKEWNITLPQKHRVGILFNQKNKEDFFEILFTAFHKSMQGHDMVKLNKFYENYFKKGGTIDFPLYYNIIN